MRVQVAEDPALVPGAVEESLRMFPAFAHFGRTATHDTELHGQAIAEGDKVVMWYPSSNRDEDRYEDVDTFDLRRRAEHLQDPRCGNPDADHGGPGEAEPAEFRQAIDPTQYAACVTGQPPDRGGQMHASIERR